MRVGMLTGGGDCPGLNAVIRAIVRKGCFHYEDQFVGFLEGWRGVLEDKTMPLDLSSVGGILPRGLISEFPIQRTFLTLQVILTEFIREQACSNPDALKLFLGNELVVVFLFVHP